MHLPRNGIITCIIRKIVVHVSKGLYKNPTGFARSQDERLTREEIKFDHPNFNPFHSWQTPLFRSSEPTILDDLVNFLVILK